MRTFSDKPLIVTATIAPIGVPYLVLKDENTRLHQYVSALLAWIKLTDVSPIIFCDNSGSRYDFSRIQEIAKAHGKTLEVLRYSDNKLAQKKGKGAGEGEILKHIMAHSIHLEDEMSFYKVTGRIFIANFGEIDKNHLCSQNVFDVPFWIKNRAPSTPAKRSVVRNLLSVGKQDLKMRIIGLRIKGLKGPHRPDQQLLTTFYKCNVGFYKRCLLNAYRSVNDHLGYFLEHAFYDHLSSDEYETFQKAPELAGITASVGIPYFTDVPSEIKEMASKIL